MNEIENQFKLPDESKGDDDSNRRVSDLIEEIRADIDFELDDAVTDIVRDLPNAYFQRTDRKNQVVHLKGLIASRICQLNGELFLPSTDGSTIAVLGRSNFRGQLAHILSELPGKKTRLVGANVYTSKSHDFILDVFEFETDLTQAAHHGFNSEVAARLAQETEADEQLVTDFLSRIRTAETESPDIKKLARFFRTSQKLNNENPIVVDRCEVEPSLLSVVVAIRATDERLTFQRTTEALSQESLDIEQAELMVLRHEKGPDAPEAQRSEKTILMNFLLSESEATGSNVDGESWVIKLCQMVFES
jgi:UTP:GlnB (protein PII) uridylyltransferase